MLAWKIINSISIFFISKIRQAKSFKIPVIFPAKIPNTASLGKFYIYTETTNNGYCIYIDSTKDCKGVHSCNVGSITAEKNGKLEKLTDLNNKTLTIPVKLANDRQAYFTPAHAMGDYWPTNLQWLNNNILYTINWQLMPITERDTIISLANNAK